MEVHLRTSHRFAFALAALLGCSSALAVEQNPPTETQTYGDWTVRCFPVQSDGPCDLAQESTNQQTKQRLVVISIAYAPRNDRYAVTIVVPLGVQLPSGLVIAHGDYRSKPFPFRRCEDDGCYVEAALDPAVIEVLSKGADKSSLNITAFAGGAISLPLSLKGFPQAMVAMKRLAQEKTAIASK